MHSSELIFVAKISNPVALFKLADPETGEIFEEWARTETNAEHLRRIVMREYTKVCKKHPESRIMMDVSEGGRG